ncbi:MAG: hypothetical protein LWX56_09180 [Ignavibacteria bacterium]|nr:hypothetical protein [Ignavibacteria bacterium]
MKEITFSDNIYQKVECLMNYPYIKNVALLIIIYLIVINANSFSAPENPKIPTKTVVNQFLTDSAKIDYLNSEIQDLRDKIAKNEYRYESVNALVATSDKYLSYAGWVGILSTVLIFFIGSIAAFSFFQSKQELERVISDSKIKLEAAQKRYDDFINSPQKIREVLEKINFMEIMEGIKSEDETIFLQNLSRAYNLSDDSRSQIANIIKSRLYQPHENNVLYQIYYFVKQNSIEPTQNYAYKLWLSLNKKLQERLANIVINDIFSKRPFPIQAIEFMQEYASFTINNYYLIMQNLSDDEKIEVVKAIIENKVDIDENVIKQYLGDLKNELTDCVVLNLSKIKENEFNKFQDLLNYDSQIIEYCINVYQEGVFKYGQYVDRHLKDELHLKDFLSFAHKYSDKLWIEVIKHFANEIDNKRIMELIYEKYTEIKGLINSSEFTQKHLPKLFEKNYGITKNDNQYYYDNIRLEIFQQSTFFGGPIFSVVNHPILKIPININSIRF